MDPLLNAETSISVFLTQSIDPSTLLRFTHSGPPAGKNSLTASGGIYLGKSRTVMPVSVGPAQNVMDTLLW